MCMCKENAGNTGAGAAYVFSPFLIWRLLELELCMVLDRWKLHKRGVWLTFALSILIAV